MFELQGKFSNAKVFSDNYDEKASGQIINLCNQDFTSGASVRIMPDYHFGSGCTIGFTANLGEKVVPNLTGVDIGCGMFVVELGKMELNLEQLDGIIHKYVPAGKESHVTKKVSFNKINDLICYRDLRHQGVFEKQIGTLGGGELIAL